VLWGNPKIHIWVGVGIEEVMGNGKVEKVKLKTTEEDNMVYIKQANYFNSSARNELGRSYERCEWCIALGDGY